MAETRHDTIRAVQWTDQGLQLLDQRVLPLRHEHILLEDVDGVADAIRDMVVRGAPAIGVAAAYGVVLAARARYAQSPATWKQDIEADLQHLAAARPTAVNLFWAIARMRQVIHSLPTPPFPAERAHTVFVRPGGNMGEGNMSGRINSDPVPGLLAEAQRIHEEDIAANRRMGELGAELIARPCAVLTHCNTGSLATGGYGTALGVIRAAYAAGKINGVYADETRPWLQGARLTAWELVQEGIPVTVVVEGAAAHLMKQGGVRWVIVGADRIAANGDTANKIGTYLLAVAARYHGVKFMVVAPTTTVDMSIHNGSSIQIETRSPDEVLSLHGQRLAAQGAEAWNPSFDVTPAELIDAIVTEKGVVTAPTVEKMAAMMGRTPQPALIG
jgi:methylthioribose-1-phosphate isomerase